MPFEDPQTAKLYKKILSGDFSIPRFVSSPARDLIKSILSIDPGKRYKADDIRHHEWYQEYNKGALFTDNLINEDIVISYTVLNQLEQFKFDKIDAEQQIKANKHNQVTTTYYLLLKKYEKEKKKRKIKRVEADLFNEDNNQTQPPLYPQNLSVSQKIKGDYFQKSQLNQTLPVTSRVPDVMPNSSKNKTDSFDFGSAKRTFDVNTSKHHVYMETSRAEQQAGINVSYDNSFTAIKRDIQKAVGDKPVESVPSTFATSANNKLEVDDMPPNKPNEAIMISDTIKVNENNSKEILADPSRQDTNYSLPDEFDEVAEVIETKKYSISQSKDYSIPESSSQKPTSLSFSTVRNPGSAKHYSTKAQTSMMTYDANAPTKKKPTHSNTIEASTISTGNNFSYSNRPKTTHYLTNNVPKTSGSITKNQANNFMDTSTSGKSSEMRQKDPLDKYKKYSNNVDVFTSSARQSRTSQNHPSSKPSNSVNVAESEISESQSVP